MFALPRTVENFIAATNTHDVEAVAAVFANEATVRDRGAAFTGAAEIRDWIQVQLVNPRIVITPTSFAGDRLVATADGKFPCGPVSFAFVFVITNDQITDLAIDSV